jgi:phosphoribosylformylglycinamidine cyclo-ligase
VADRPKFYILLKICTLLKIISSRLPLFQQESQTDWKEMYQVFNMGHRLEVYLPEKYASDIIAISQSFGIEARIVGYVEASEHKKLTIKTTKGTFEYE